MVLSQRGDRVPAADPSLRVKKKKHKRRGVAAEKPREGLEGERKSEVKNWTGRRTSLSGKKCSPREKGGGRRRKALLNSAVGVRLSRGEGPQGGGGGGVGKSALLNKGGADPLEHSYKPREKIKINTKSSK